MESAGFVAGGSGGGYGRFVEASGNDNEQGGGLAAKNGVRAVPYPTPGFAPPVPPPVNLGNGVTSVSLFTTAAAAFPGGIAALETRTTARIAGEQQLSPLLSSTPPAPFLLSPGVGHNHPENEKENQQPRTGIGKVFTARNGLHGEVVLQPARSPHTLEAAWSLPCSSLTPLQRKKIAEAKAVAKKKLLETKKRAEAAKAKAQGNIKAAFMKEENPQKQRQPQEGSAGYDCARGDCIPLQQVPSRYSACPFCQTLSAEEHKTS